MGDSNNINWYPGHMNKARIMMQENMKLIDLVIEIIDARAPSASRNPDIDKMASGKSRLIIMNKCDLSDPSMNRTWSDHFKSLGFSVVMLNSKDRNGINSVLPAVKEACRDKIERNLKRGIKNQPIRAMVAGIPNVGKSTFINAFSGKNVSKTGNKPGVTKGKQWITINKELELLDTPGILWPKFDDNTVGEKLAMLGSINDEILVVEELAGKLLVMLFQEYPKLLFERYKITESIVSDESDPTSTPQSRMLSHIAVQRGCIKKGGEVDWFKTAGLVIDEFRSGKIGLITLEKP